MKANDELEICNCFLIDKLACFKREYCIFLNKRNIGVLENEFKLYNRIEQVIQYRISVNQTTTQKIAEIKICEAFLKYYQKTHPLVGNDLKTLSISTNSDYFNIL